MEQHVKTLGLLGLSVLGIGALFGQLNRGYISGTVEDQSAGLVEGVAVKITNKATNLSNETRTNAQGQYRFVAVEPGVYAVELVKAGFETRRVEGVSVSTAQEVTLNQTLRVAGTATMIEVQEAPPGVELAKSTATIDRTLSQIVIQSIPLTGATRDVNTLALLAPTVNRGPGSTQISASGNRARNNNFMLDGVDNNDVSVTLTASRVIPEALSEFQVQTTSYSAEYGRSSGAQLMATTKSGTNAFHGEVYNYYRGNWVEPVSLLNKRAGVLKTPRFVHNQAGGAIGGPVIRNRTFFFGLFDANIRREAPDARNAAAITIPTPLGFAALASVPLLDGQTAQSRQDMLKTLSFLPEIHQTIGANYQNLTNVNVNGIPIQVGNARIPLANPNDYFYYLARADHRFTDQHNFSYRMQLDKQTNPDFISNLGFGSRFAGAQTNFSQNHAFSLISVPTPRLVNEGRFSFVRRNLDFPENDPTSPTVTISNAFTVGGASNFPQGRVQDTFQIQDVMTAQAGRHNLKFGGDIRRVMLFNRSGFDSKGTWVFNNLADFINNKAFSLTQAVNEATFDARQTVQYYFFQDDFKATKDLTFNLGIRYETQSIPFGFFGAATDEIAAALVPRDVQRDKNNWAPRVGFAYSPSTTNGLAGKLFGGGKTVVRGGYGMGYDVLFYNILTVTASNYPRVVNTVTNQPETINLFPRLAPKQATVPAFNKLAQFVNANSDMQNPTIHFYSLSIQREVAKGYIFEIGYTGNRSYHQIRQGRLNPGTLTAAQAASVIAGQTIPSLQNRRLYPAFGDRITIESTANSKYNAGYLRFDRRLTNGLLVGANYTYSNFMSDNDESLGVADITNSAPQVPQDFRDFGPEWSRSVFDRPHRFVVHYVYQVPGKDLLSRKLGVVGKHVFGGWQIAGFAEWQSGQPFGIRTGVDTVGQGATNGARPNFNPSGSFVQDPISGDLRTFTSPINGTGWFVTPLTGGGSPLANSAPSGGNLGRNTFRGPSYTNWNFALSKTLDITERWKIEVRSDFINLWNHRNFGNPVAAMNAANFGQNTTNPGTRTMLLAARIRF